MELKKIKNLLTNLSGQIYLVGGAVRDYFLDEELTDIDLAIKGTTKQIAKELAARIEGSFVTLDKEREMYRIVSEDIVYDLSPLAGDKIKFDLAQRDFTINALALDLSNLRSPEDDLIDPYDGLTGLREGRLKVVSKRSFVDDPLRILRMVRFKAQFGFEILTTTKNLAQKWADEISAVANERIKGELLKTCSYEGSAKNLALLAELGIISSLLPQADKLTEMGRCQYHQEDIWTHSIAAVEEIENLLANPYWQTKVDETKLPLLKLAALLHDYGKLFTAEEIEGKVHFYGHQKVGVEKLRPILKDLAFSNQELDYILHLVRYHMRPFSLYKAENLTFKGKYNFFKAAKEFVEDICLLSAADKLSTAKLNDRQREIADFLEFLKELIADREERKERSGDELISGDDLIEEFGLEEGPKIGEILAEIDRLQAKGDINSRQEAMAYLKDNLIAKL